MEQLVKALCYWNDSLDKMMDRLLQESMRRRLRVRFSTGNIDQLEQLQAAASLLKHRDLEEMASARTVIEKGYYLEEPSLPSDLAATATSHPPTPGRDAEFRLEMNQLDFGPNMPFMTDQVSTRGFCDSQITFLGMEIESSDFSIVSLSKRENVVLTAVSSLDKSFGDNFEGRKYPR